MKFTFAKVFLTALLLSTSLISFAQKVTHILPEGYDPDKNKIIPDKVFEIGLPLLVLFVLANSIVSVFRIRAENRLKEKAFDKELSEATLVTLFAEDKNILKYSYLKWFLVLASLGLSFLFLYFLDQLTGTRSGYLAMGIITVFLSISFLIYYNIIKDK
jgi:hypothetical protein